MKNLIGGKHIINEQNGALSLVRRKKKEKEHHAYLILELINENGDLELYDAHLGQNENDKTKAKITFRKIDIEQVMKVGEDCHSYTWNINQEQMKSLKVLIDSEMERAEGGKINYIPFGKSNVSGKLAVSLDNAYSTEVKKRLQVVSKNPSMQSLLYDGHNCYSWARGIIEALELVAPKNHWTSFFAADPHRFKGTNVGQQKNTADGKGESNDNDNKEPMSPKPSCMMM